MQPRLSAPAEVVPLGDGVMLTEGMRAHVEHTVAASQPARARLPDPDAWMGGCEQLLIHDRPDCPGIPGANAQLPARHLRMNPMRDMT
jgi:hypothetical protein